MCRILGAFATLGENREKVDFESELRRVAGMSVSYEECGTPDDERATEYLQGTLKALKDRVGLNLVPKSVSSDGSCLPHAISCCLVGREFLYDGLRSTLHNELTENKDFYMKLGEFSLYEDKEEEYQRVILAAAPTHGLKVGVDKYLHQIHLFAFANLLRRPIFLIDSMENNNDYSGAGLYPPMRHTREQIIEFHGHVPSAIAIGYASGARNHYVPLLNKTASQYEERRSSLINNARETLYLFLQELTSQGTNSNHMELMEQFKERLSVILYSKCAKLVVDFTHFGIDHSTLELDEIVLMNNFLVANSPSNVAFSARVLRRYIDMVDQNRENSGQLVVSQEDPDIEIGILNVQYADCFMDNSGFVRASPTAFLFNLNDKERTESKRRNMLRFLDAILREENQPYLQVEGVKDISMDFFDSTANTSLIRKPVALSDLSPDAMMHDREVSLGLLASLPMDNNGSRHISFETMSLLHPSLWFQEITNRYGSGPRDAGTCMSIANSVHKKEGVAQEIKAKLERRLTSVLLPLIEEPSYESFASKFNRYPGIVKCRCSLTLALSMSANDLDMAFFHQRETFGDTFMACPSCDTILFGTQCIFYRSFDHMSILFNAPSMPPSRSAQITSSDADSAPTPVSSALMREFDIDQKTSRTNLAHTNRDLDAAKNKMKEIMEHLEKMKNLLNFSEAQSAQALIETGNNFDQACERYSEIMNVP